MDSLVESEQEFRILHVVPGLDRGGAEVALLRLLGASDTVRAVSQVLSLGAGGALLPAFREMGVPVLGSSSPSWKDNVADGASPRLIVHAWMYRAAAHSIMLRRTFPNARHVWALRTSKRPWKS